MKLVSRLDHCRSHQAYLTVYSNSMHTQYEKRLKATDVSKHCKLNSVPNLVDQTCELLK